MIQVRLKDNPNQGCLAGTFTILPEMLIGFGEGKAPNTTMVYLVGGECFELDEKYDEFRIAVAQSLGYDIEDEAFLPNEDQEQGWGNDNEIG